MNKNDDENNGNGNSNLNNDDDSNHDGNRDGDGNPNNDNVYNNNSNNSNNNNNLNSDNSDNDLIFNAPISINEVTEAIKKLKNGKAHGVDLILNEFIKSGSDKLHLIFTKLFNIIFESGIIPKDWSLGIIRPIYKNKGSRSDPNNYRGITILSCLGKLFTSILNERLNDYLDQNNILGNEQAGFRKNFSTTNHLFTLYGVIDILLSQKKRLYSAFLDFEKAFDKIDRSFLWQKLLASNINGKLLTVIKNIYSNAKSFVIANNTRSELFQINNGVRQGENLSPVLFAIFLNDMNNSLNDTLTGLNSVADVANTCGMNGDVINLFLKLFILLYADDTVIFTETPTKLQDGLNCIKKYCDKWKLKLNPSKCKIMIFSRGKVRVFPEFFIGNEKLEVVHDFMYLGTKLNYNNKMIVCQKDLCQRATRAMFCLLKKCSLNNLPLDVITDLFEKIVVPVATYGCEVWGFDTNDILEKMQMKFLKILFKLRKSTPSFLILGELGIFPLKTIIKCRVLNYWFKLNLPENANKLSSIVYKCLHKMYITGVHENSYLKFIHKSIIEVGLPYLWETHDMSTTNAHWFKSYVKMCIQDLFITEWSNKISNDSIYINYKTFKDRFCAEEYISLLPYNCVISMIRFRTTNNKLPVNTFRFLDIVRENRICTKCNIGSVGDEFHYILNCSYFNEKRKECLKYEYQNHPNQFKYKKLMNTKDKRELLKLKHFIDFINNSM